ncbi:unnamed protein product, partial [Hapterophycus canaliculatus]
PQRAPLEGKREDESMRQFNKRVREGTAQLLKDEFKEHSTTNKRRKKYLDDKKRKNKLKKQGLWEEVQRRERLDEEQAAADFDGAETARGAGGGTGGRGGRGRQGGDNGGEGGGGNNWGALGRADDEEGTQFPQKELIRFGDVAHAPPDLAKIPKPRGFKHQGQAKPWARQAAAVGNAAGNGGAGGATPAGHSSGDDKQGQAQSRRQKKRNKASKNGDRAIGGSGEEKAEQEGEGGEEDEEQRKEQRQMEADAKKAQKRQMEEMRLRVQQAYSGLKKKRRAGQTQFVGSDL